MKVDGIEGIVIYLDDYGTVERNKKVVVEDCEDFENVSIKVEDIKGNYNWDKIKKKVEIEKANYKIMDYQIRSKFKEERSV